MRGLKKLFASALFAGTAAFTAHPETLTIVSVNNGDMIRMQKLSSVFTRENPDIKLDFQFLEENILRQKVTADIANKGGQYDVMTIGMYEAPIWGKKGWLVSMNDLPASFDAGDILPAVRDGLSYNGVMYAAPFYGESSFLMYRKDLFRKHHLTMPEQPTWGEVYNFAGKIHDPAKGINGICLRGKAGWGENMAFLTTLVNGFGGRWFDENWMPELNSPAWTHAVSFYVDMMQNYGPKGAQNNGFNENLKLFNTGKCGIWIDATSAGSFVTNMKDSQVWDKVDFAMAPSGLTRKTGWLWSWALGIPAGTQKAEAAKRFVAWATSKEYIEMVAEKYGWSNIPPGTRTTFYKNPNYTFSAAFADMTLKAMNEADPVNGTMKPKPYVGVQFVAIPEFQGIGTFVGQQLSAALAGRKSVKDALNSAQRYTMRTMKKSGYIK